MGLLGHKTVRIGAFLATMAGATALVGAAATSTGAYFTDTHAGTINGTFGKIALRVDNVTVPTGDSATGTDDLAIQWNNMLPGQDKTVTFKVTNITNNAESIWLAFDNSNNEWANINTLGSFGDAKINSPNINQDYNNLNNLYPEGTPPNPGQKNSCGDPEPAIAYLPAENHVMDLAPGASGTFTFSFGFTACLSANALQGNTAFAAPLLYDIIATQPGITPDDTHNGGIYTLPQPPAGGVGSGHTWNT